MLWPTHTISARRQGGTTDYVSSRSVYVHSRHPNRDLQVGPAGQPLSTFLQDNGPSRPAYARGDMVTLTACLDGSPLPPQVTFTVDDVESRGHLFSPYVELQLTAVGR